MNRSYVLQILYQFRDPTVNKFRERILRGKVFICEKHFEINDIQQSSCKSWIKFGALPTQNLPQKRVQSKTSKPRRQIMKHPVAAKQAKPAYTTISSLKDAYVKSHPIHWRMHCTSDAYIHFTLFKDHLLHAIPDHSILITYEAASYVYHMLSVVKMFPIPPFIH